MPDPILDEDTINQLKATGQFDEEMAAQFTGKEGKTFEAGAEVPEDNPLSQLGSDIGDFFSPVVDLVTNPEHPVNKAWDENVQPVIDSVGQPDIPVAPVDQPALPGLGAPLEAQPVQAEGPLGFDPNAVQNASLQGGQMNNLLYNPNEGIQQQQAGIGLQEGAAEDLGLGTATIYKGLNDEIKRMENLALVNDFEREEEIDLAVIEYNTAAEEAANMKVDNDFWGRKSTGQKIAGFLAIAMSGYLSGRQGRSENVALQMINREIQRDVQAQKFEIAGAKESATGKKTVLADMKARFKDDRLAENLTTQAAYKKAQNSIAALQAQTASQVAKGKLQVMNGQLQTKVDALNQKARSKFILKTALASGGDVPPELYEEKDQARYVRGYGLAPSPVEAAKAREVAASYESGSETLDQLIALADQGSSLSLSDKDRGDSLARGLRGELRVAIMGPGTLTKEEAEILAKIVPSPQELFAMDSRTIVRLKTLKETLNMKFNNQMKFWNLDTRDEKVKNKLKFEAN